MIVLCISRQRGFTIYKGRGESKISQKGGPTSKGGALTYNLAYCFAENWMKKKKMDWEGCKGCAPLRSPPRGELTRLHLWWPSFSWSIFTKSEAWSPYISLFISNSRFTSRSINQVKFLIVGLHWSNDFAMSKLFLVLMLVAAVAFASKKLFSRFPGLRPLTLELII